MLSISSSEGVKVCLGRRVGEEREKGGGKGRGERKEEGRKMRLFPQMSFLSYSQFLYLSSVIGCGGSHSAGEYLMRGSVDRSIASHSGS